MTTKIISTDSNKFAWEMSRAKTLILAAAFISFLLSVTLWFSGDKQAGLFVGIWVPSICSAGSLILRGGSYDG